MKMYFHLTCYFGHRWGGFFEEDAEVQEFCPEGHEAIILQKYRPIDQVQITLKPAGRLDNFIADRCYDENKVQILVSTIEGDWEYQSKQFYSWREAETIVRMFEKRSLAQARKIIDRRIEQNNPI